MTHTLIPALIAALLLTACTNKPAHDAPTSDRLPIVGTWQLLSGTLIENGDTTVTDYTQKTPFIKIINDTHFAFLLHDLTKGKDSAVYSSGGGRYNLADSLYTEHLTYCSDRQWEGNDFVFTVTIKNDTLTQTGVEKIESAGINRINTEQYVRVKQ
ncbi:MAG: lipocalin-like domain-containing protein [Spirosoma sp.]|nr:lipocalin-like domain-containing protein [Spirosoma sp.]